MKTFTFNEKQIYKSHHKSQNIIGFLQGFKADVAVESVIQPARFLRASYLRVYWCNGIAVFPYFDYHFFYLKKSPQFCSDKFWHSFKMK